jgi:hypothetical protein
MRNLKGDFGITPNKMRQRSSNIRETVWHRMYLLPEHIRFLLPWKNVTLTYSSVECQQDPSRVIGFGAGAIEFQGTA